MAPARSASTTCSSASNVVSMTTAVGRSGRPRSAGPPDAVEPRHADVDQRDVGPQLAAQRHGVDAVGGLADHLEAGLGLQDHPQPGPDERLVVGQQHPDRHTAAGSGAGTGSSARTRQPGPSSRGPAVTRPSNRATRSRMPTSPCPAGARPAGAAAPSSDHATSSVRSV